ncbi:UbiA prenyltransferase family protein [Pedobacter sp. SYSU D00535]|uniref:UbiA prenyltransferase family protein n=1 Tax=Pedobacter sp. SYSU D00535 TaxID=2810308 RepID=UPI001A96B304|nr:UbiA prenyltransferase family protein [Pedobacter sp. SYSU D00535]
MNHSSTIPNSENTLENVVLRPAGLKEYVTIARPDHWFKNIFMLPGMLFAFLVYNTPLSFSFFFNLVAGVVATCLIASANYVINEYLDAEFDRFHPLKKNRSAVQTVLNPVYVGIQWFVLAGVGLTISYFINMPFLALEAFLLFMGIMYNVRPFRTKERVYLDVLSESVNNPIRLALGWFIFVPAALLPQSFSDPSWMIIPPSSIILAYWMGGAFLMATKRFAEYRFINNPEQAGLYRRSFKYYTENSLLISMFFYALTSAFFLGIFLIKHRIELIISFPFFALLFAWYLQIGLRKDSVVQGPEKLHREKKFMAYVIAFVVLLMALIYIDIPALTWFLKQSFQYN